MTSEQIQKIDPALLAEKLVNVQPMNLMDFKALSEDPLANALLERFLDRCK